MLSGPIAAAWAFLVMVEPPLKGIAAGWGLTIVLSDIFWLTPWQKRLRDSAARIQEAFDCDVLELPWNDIKVGKRPDPELVSEQAGKYEKWSATMPTLRNWYPPTVDELPLSIARIACQRSNCWWDANQRRRYATVVIAAIAFVFAAVLGFSLYAGLTVENFILQVVAPLAPALLLGVRQYSEQMEAAGRLERLKEHAERLWNEALSAEPSYDLVLGARNLQDEIFENRRKSPLVFDAIFKKLRPRYERQMNRGIDDLVSQAKERAR